MAEVGMNQVLGSVAQGEQILVYGSFEFMECRAYNKLQARSFAAAVLVHVTANLPVKTRR